LSIKNKLGLYFAIFVTVILIITNALYYFSTRNLLLRDQENQMELLAKEISITIEHSQYGANYIEDLIGERLRIVSMAVQKELDPDIRNVTNAQLAALSRKLGVSHITLLVKDGDDIKGIKSSDPNETNLSTKDWGYWFTAFKQLFESKNVTIPEGQKLPNYWSGPINVAASDPNHIDKYGYYYDGTSNYIINPYVQDEQIMEFMENLAGPNPIIDSTLKNNPMVLAIAGFNPKTFGAPPVYYEQNGHKFIALENQEISFGKYAYLDKEKDVQIVRKTANSGEILSFLTVSEGQKVLKTFIPIQSGNPYVIGIVTDYKFIQHLLNQQLLNQLVISLVILLIVYIGSYFFAGYIVRPFNYILRKVNKIAEGNFTVRVVINRNDELGLLGQRIDMMSQNLLEYTRELEGKRAEIEYQANYDFLTGLPNRRLFNEQIKTSIEVSARETATLALLFIDLDRFKNINDIFGHSVGDLLLRSVAERLLNCFGKEEIISRFSGDEFVVLIPNATRAVAMAKAKIVLDELSRPFSNEADEMYVSSSIGISQYPADGEDVETLIKNADVAMYRAKEQGRNGYQFYSADMNEGIMRKNALEKGLYQALERNELVLFYQPQIDLITGKIIGSEALIRWQHPEFGLIPPIEFISLAEETGLIVPIGEWVIRTACAQNKKWLDRGETPMSISVNLSARQFQQKNLVESIIKSLSDTGLPPEYLKLEITESIALYNEEYVIDKLHTLKNIGIKIAIDDFGTGYSSLSYLKKFPIDSLKIDKSFIGDITSDSGNEEIVKTIIAMARNMKLNVIAEGVETQQQLLFLKEHKCNEAQGYIFSKPLSVQQFDMMFTGLQQAAAGKLTEK
jgi:diguanylate cyclase (GGDEF)-like protein